MRLHTSIPNKKSVMVNLGHSKLWVESVSGQKQRTNRHHLKVEGAKVADSQNVGTSCANSRKIEFLQLTSREAPSDRWSLIRFARFGALEPAIDPPSRAEKSDHFKNDELLDSVPSTPNLQLTRHN
ncbi:hypothetical protein F2Q69_00014096 [Brassica cretica]|uniref:Uncharacterized protein n=1 Tax=Brassica cretica TaxID=69181 RepID=A0A8S9QYI4_BRACR|nr:hypothetical protein F2Q69_00014096 [Brassica cretica]